MKISYHSEKEGNPSHNDRTFDITKASHIDPARIKDNRYWCWDVGANFREAERRFYRENYQDMVEQQNRYRVDKRTTDDYLTLTRYMPEEIILQIGAMDDQPDDPDVFDSCFDAFIDFLKEWNENHGDHMHILDYAVHKDEVFRDKVAIHAHLRVTWDYQDERGIRRLSRDMALKLAGVGLADPNRPASRTNTRKIAFDRICKERWTEICEERGIKVDRTARGEKHKAIRDYKRDKRLEEIETMRRDTKRISEIINQTMAAIPEEKREMGPDGTQYVIMTPQECQAMLLAAKQGEESRKNVKKRQEEISSLKNQIIETDQKTDQLRQYQSALTEKKRRLLEKMKKNYSPERIEVCIDEGKRAIEENPELLQQIMTEFYRNEVNSQEPVPAAVEVEKEIPNIREEEPARE